MKVNHFFFLLLLVTQYYNIQAQDTVKFETEKSSGDSTYGKPALRTEAETGTPDKLKLLMLNGYLNIVWKDVYRSNPNIMGYNVYRREPGNTNFSDTTFELLSGGIMKPGVNYFIDTLIVEGKKYEYQVKSVDSCGKESRTGPVAAIIIPVTKPLAPGGMSLFTGTDGITIKWEEKTGSGIVAYKIYRYERGTRPVTIATVKEGTTQYVDTTVKKETLYFYYLTAVHKNGTESSPGKIEEVWKY